MGKMEEEFKKRKEEILTREQMEKMLVEIAIKYTMFQKSAPKKYDDVFLTSFEDLLA